MLKNSLDAVDSAGGIAVIKLQRNLQPTITASWQQANIANYKMYERA